MSLMVLELVRKYAFDRVGGVGKLFLFKSDLECDLLPFTMTRNSFKARFTSISMAKNTMALIFLELLYFSTHRPRNAKGHGGHGLSTFRPIFLPIKISI